MISLLPKHIKIMRSVLEVMPTPSRRPLLFDRWFAFSSTNATPADYETFALQGGGSEIDAAGSHPGGRSLNPVWVSFVARS